MKSFVKTEPQTSTISSRFSSRLVFANVVPGSEMENTWQHLPNFLPPLLVLSLKRLLALNTNHQGLPICILLKRMRAVPDTLDIIQLEVSGDARLASGGTRGGLLEVKKEGVCEGLLHLP